MKKIIFVLIMMLPLIGNAQAHLALTLTEIKALYPDKVFKVNYTNDGTKYAYTDMSLGMFFYYFDSKTGLTNLCLQVPDDMIALNTQVEIYNKKYVIVSETSWKAYLEDGGLIKIDLTYDEELKNYIFIYTHYGYYTHLVIKLKPFKIRVSVTLRKEIIRNMKKLTFKSKINKLKKY